MQKLISQRLLSITEPWEDDLEEDQIRLVFESQTLMISAVDHGEPGHMSGASIYAEVIK